MVSQILRTRSDFRRETILEVAGEIFLQEGYAAASMSAIAARLGGSKGTLYNYFTSKTELFAAYMTEACRAYSEAVFASFDENTPIRPALRRIGVGFLDFVLKDEPMAVHRVVVAEAQRFPELGQAFYDSGPKITTARLAGWLQQRMDRGELRPSDPSTAASQFLALCKSGPYSRRFWNIAPPAGAAEILAHVDATVDMFLAAYGARDRQ